MRKTCLVLSMLLVVSCSESPTTPSRIESGAERSDPAVGLAEHDAPWRTMPGPLLREMTRMAGGRVFINLRSAHSPRGVSPAGMILVGQPALTAAKDALRNEDLEILREFDSFPTVVARVSPSMVDRLRALPFVESIEPIFPGRRHSLVDGTTTQVMPWQNTAVRAEQAWRVTRGSGVNVWIIDSGQPRHEDLHIHSAVGCAQDTDIYDHVGHATAVAGIIRAVDNSRGYIGLSPDVNLSTVKDGDAVPDPEAMLCGVLFAKDAYPYRADVINISSEVAPYDALTNAIRAAYSEGVVFVASSGNDGPESATTYPASLAEVIAVGSTNGADGIADWTPENPEVVAPGDNLWSTTIPNTQPCVGSYYGECTGSSFAAPMVTATVALIIAEDWTRTPAEVREQLQTSAIDLGQSGYDEVYGYGRIDAAAAVGYQKPPFLISISGPICLANAGYYTYTASVTSGDEPPFTFSWARMKYPWTNWYPAGSGAQKTLYFAGGSYGEKIRVIARDNTGASTTRIIEVYMGATASPSPGLVEDDGERHQTICGGGEEPPLP